VTCISTAIADRQTSKRSLRKFCQFVVVGKGVYVLCMDVRSYEKNFLVDSPNRFFVLSTLHTQQIRKGDEKVLLTVCLTTNKRFTQINRKKSVYYLVITCIK